MSDPSAPEDGGEKNLAKKPGKLALSAISLAAFAIVGGGVFFLAQAPGKEQLAVAAEVEHSPGKPDSSNHAKPEKGHAKQEKGHGEAEKKSDHGSAGGEGAEGKFSVIDGVGVYALDPIVVSIRPSHSVRHLKVAIVVETTPDAGDTFMEREARIRDTLNIYLAAVDSSTFEDPMALIRIREQISRRISTVVSPTPVFAILITDFILT